MKRTDRIPSVFEVDVRANPDFLAFERADEALAHRIVGWCARTTPTLLEAVLKQFILIDRAAVLTATIGMVNERISGLTGNQRHVQRFQCQLSGHPYSESPPDASSTIGVDQNGQVDPARS